MLIRNFGHLWERRYIQWGRGGVKGHLHGYRKPTDSGADFRDQIGIYVLFDKQYSPVYVGQVGSGKQRLLGRLNQHTSDHLWNRWEYFTWFGFRRVNPVSNLLSEHDKPEKKFSAKGDALLNEVEAALLIALEPKLNKQGPRWKDVEEFFQTVDDELEERSVSEVLVEIADIKKQVAGLRNHKKTI
ncbi:MAG: hypothetical protein KGI42_09345 [Xanthomonadaceae bacterium]|nr:hypothetical protein [Xanthomonadaceae bacterium]